MKKTKNTREKIISKALQLYGQHGVHAVTPAMVSRAAGIPQPLLIYHFSKNEELLVEVVRLVLDRLRARSLDAIEKNKSSPVQALLAYAEAPFAWAAENPREFSVWMYFYYLSARDGMFRTINDSIRATGRERIGQLVYEAIARKQVKSVRAEDVPVIALNIQNAITGGVILAGTESSHLIENSQEFCRRTILEHLGVGSV